MESLEQRIELKKKELAALPQPSSVRLAKGMSNFCLASALLLLGFGLPGCVFDSGEGAWGGWTWMFWIGILMLILTSVFGSRIQEMAKRDKSTEAKNLERELATLRGRQRKFTSAKKELAKIEKELDALAPGRFGAKSTEELEKVRASRRALIGRIMGSEQTQDSKPKPVPAKIIDKVIGYVPKITPPEGFTCEDGEDSLRGWCEQVAEGFSKENAADHKAATDMAKTGHTHLVDFLARAKGGVVVRFTEGQMVVICDKLLPCVPKEFLTRLTKEGISANTAVDWRKKFYGGEVRKNLFAWEVLPFSGHPS